jgi:hypothetical protein
MSEDDLAKAQGENAHLQQHTLPAQRELQPRRHKGDTEATPTPWWKSLNVTAIVALVSAVAPITAGVQGCFERKKELAIEATKVAHDQAMAREKQTEDFHERYLDRLKDPDERRRLLRLLLATTKDPDLKTWAEQERPFVEAESARVEADRERRQKLEERALELAEQALAKQPERLAEHYVQLARDLGDGKGPLGTPTFVGMYGGQAGGARLSDALDQLRKAKTKCLESGKDAMLCSTESRLAQDPQDADITLIRQLEAEALHGDTVAQRRLHEQRVTFLKPEGR